VFFMFMVHLDYHLGHSFLLGNKMGNLTSFGKNSAYYKRLSDFITPS